MIRSSDQPGVQNRICVLLPDGRGVRSFVWGPFLRTISQTCQVDLVHGMHDSALREVAVGFGNAVQWHSFAADGKHPVLNTVKKSLAFAQMYWVDNFPMRRRIRRSVTGTWRTKAATHAARLIGRAAASPGGMRILSQLQNTTARQLPEVSHYRRYFRQTRPTVLFSSQQEAPQVLAPVIAAKSLDIPTATFIRSWDNLSSKGRIAAPFDHYLVWGEQMRDEMKQFYPEVPAERIHIVGTPQFDTYADRDLLLSRNEFCRQIGADPQRKLICYSGGVAHIAPEDPQHVESLMQSIRDGLIKHQPQVLLRRCPSDDGSRYEHVRQAYPEMLYTPPQCMNGQPGNWMSVIPRKDDVQTMANLMRHADLNINFASTMTLDFASQDKPVINVAFDVTNPPSFGMPMWTYYRQWDHYRPVIESGAARFARSADELVEHVNAYLDNPELERDNRRRLTQLQVGVPVGQSSQKIIDVLSSISSAEPSGELLRAVSH